MSADYQLSNQELLRTAITNKVWCWNFGWINCDVYRLKEKFDAEICHGMS